MFFRAFTILLLLVVSLVGCSRPGPAVTGKVTFTDGSPLTVGEVLFDNGSILARATIQPDGSFSLGMVKDGEGVPVGQYKVSIFGALDFSKNPRWGDLLIDQKHTSASTSGLMFDVKKEQKNVCDIVVEPSPYYLQLQKERQ